MKANPWHLRLRRMFLNVSERCSSAFVSSDCRFNCHRRCEPLVPRDCPGERKVTNGDGEQFCFSSRILQVRLWHPPLSGSVGSQKRHVTLSGDDDQWEDESGEWFHMILSQWMFCPGVHRHTWWIPESLFYVEPRCKVDVMMSLFQTPQRPITAAG